MMHILIREWFIKFFSLDKRLSHVLSHKRGFYFGRLCHFDCKGHAGIILSVKSRTTAV